MNNIALRMTEEQKADTKQEMDRRKMYNAQIMF